MNRSLRIAVVAGMGLGLLCPLFFCASAAGQGTRSDYERANRLHELFDHKVINATLSPHWLEGNTRFWYRRELHGGGREFILVDAIKGTRQPAFDHARLAESLAKLLKKKLDATKLPIDRIQLIDGDNAALIIAIQSKRWKCDLKTYQLSELKSDDFAGMSLPKLPAVRASKRTGDPTVLTFVNHLAGDVEIFWRDFQGGRRSYGVVHPGQSSEMSTFAGHVWQVVDRQGKTVAVFEAAREPSTAVIDDSPPPAPPKTQTRPRNRSREGARSPDGKWDAFFKDQNLWLRANDGGGPWQMTNDGSEEDAYGGGVYWSPDSRLVVVTRTKKGQEHKVYYVESSPKDQVQPKLHWYEYLKPGDRIPQTRPRLFDAIGRKQIPIDEKLFPNPWSIEDIRWDADSSRFTFFYNQRGHGVLRIIAVDAGTGQTRPIIDEVSSTFIDYAGKKFIHYLDESRQIVWMSERDGWNHLYLIDAGSGRVINQITRGPWVVRAVERVDEAARQIYFRAGGVCPGQDPYYIHHCRVNFDGSGLTVLGDGDGTHAIEYSPDGRFFVDTFSRVDLPPVHQLRRADDGKLVCELEKADWSELLSTKWQTPERFVAKGRDGQTDIYGVIFRPTNFDPKKKYPIIEQIYAGPHDSFVPKRFASFYSHQVMAELGFIVVQIDGMGTSNRSKKFHDICWKNLGDSGFPDRILWIKAAAAKYPYMDTSRVGIYGGSAGGQSSTRALLAFGDFYKVAVSDCGCHDNRMDKIWWNELWMGWPVGPHYAEQSNVTQAHNLQGKLMLTVGEMDENVDPASTMQVVNALIQAGKDFDLLVFPGKGHGCCESPYGQRRRQDFFVRHLLGVEPRSQP